MGKVQKPSNTEYYTPSSEPFRMYFENIYLNFIKKYNFCNFYLHILLLFIWLSLCARSNSGTDKPVLNRFDVGELRTNNFVAILI
jgi:hypothetical protein